MLRGISRRFEAVLALAALLLVGSARAEELPAEVGGSLKAALQAAQARHAPVLVDFYAPWCYSCYFMAKNVKNGPEWERLEQKAVVLELDADAPDGAHWMQAWSVKGLPNYIVLDEQGQELGRIQLERTRAQFYPEIDAILARGASLERLQAEVRDAGPASLKAARAVLQAFLARGQADEGLAWQSALPAAPRAAIGRDAEAAGSLARLELLRATKAKDVAACSAVLPRLLKGPASCERAYDIDRALSCTESLPASRQGVLFGGQKRALDQLLAKRVFVPTPSCADAQSIVLAAADLSAALGDSTHEAVVLDRAVDDAVNRLGGPEKLDLRRDRNLADNIRVYLDRAKRNEALDSLYPELIKAYPDDYVYAYRFGKSLATRGDYARALPWLEQAAPKAYGANRLKVAQLRSEVLIKLGRSDEARTVAAEALKANGPFFPEQAGKLKALIAGNG